MKGKLWLTFALITTACWGVWGAFIEIPEKAGFPATLGYIVWSFTMIPCMLIALKIIDWKLDRDPRSVFLGSAVGLLGAGGQLLLFLALKQGPAYIVFPLISLFPVLTVVLSMLFLRERASLKHWIGIAAAIIAIFLLSSQPSAGKSTEKYGWLFLSVLVFILWGIQAFVMKFSNSVMKAESIFFYMTVWGLLLIPAAFVMTDFDQPINWGFRGPYLAALIQVLNAAGALMLVYALRYGKAIIVVPMTGLAPLITIVISLLIYGVIPAPLLIAGMILAIIGILLLSD